MDRSLEFKNENDRIRIIQKIRRHLGNNENEEKIKYVKKMYGEYFINIDHEIKIIIEKRNKEIEKRNKDIKLEEEERRKFIEKNSHKDKDFLYKYIINFLNNYNKEIIIHIESMVTGKNDKLIEQIIERIKNEHEYEEVLYTYDYLREVYKIRFIDYYNNESYESYESYGYSD